ncbi:MAG: hypothetical protein HYT85_09565 [candidate division NC10 bacterium]|nr:hypothetical protein [candidate division NC10 bacterium]MBI2115317.1 hypothetical protein [candidate division NC10 bacterium]MBI2457097.1 hypothetical protein [candidate division NC10 bacterium]MBI3122450.1 hypothetical protein [candidate division NC10 bacterium]
MDRLKLDKTTLTVASLTDQPDDKAYWHARSPYDRVRAVEVLRQLNYGHSQSTARLQRVLEVTQLNLEDLKANKRAAGRYKDLDDLENLP